jgi:hypothetical protein
LKLHLILLREIAVRPLYHLSREFTDPLDEYKNWIFSEKTQLALESKIRIPKGKMFLEGRGEQASSIEYLMAIDHGKHRGLATDEQGFNLNYGFLRNHPGVVDPDFLEEIRTASNRLDDQLQNILGAKVCALKMYYPKGGFIGWHTNWDFGGYNIVFTYTKNGGGFWRHIDPAGSISVIPNPDKLVHLDDIPGWHCKVGYYGKKHETDRLIWHSAFAKEPRITLGYVIGEKAIWENMVEELESIPTQGN